MDQNDVVEAIVDFQLHKKPGFGQWDSEIFSVNLVAAHLAKMMVDILFD